MEEEDPLLQVVLTPTPNKYNKDKKSALGCDPGYPKPSCLSFLRAGIAGVHLLKPLALVFVYCLSLLLLVSMLEAPLGLCFCL